MNKVELMGEISKKCGILQKEAFLFVQAFSQTICEALENGENVQIAGFGTFEIRDRAARTARNPRTGEPIEIEARKALVFKPSKVLKDSVNQ